MLFRSPHSSCPFHAGKNEVGIEKRPAEERERPLPVAGQLERLEQGRQVGGAEELVAAGGEEGREGRERRGGDLEHEGLRGRGEEGAGRGRGGVVVLVLLLVIVVVVPARDGGGGRGRRGGEVEEEGVERERGGGLRRGRGREVFDFNYDLCNHYV